MSELKLGKENIKIVGENEPHQMDIRDEPALETLSETAIYLQGYNAGLRMAVFYFKNLFTDLEEALNE